MGIEDLLRGLLFDQQRAEENPAMGQPAPPPPPPPPRGGMFGGMPGWADDERPMAFAGPAEEGVPPRQAGNPLADPSLLTRTSGPAPGAMKPPAPPPPAVLSRPPQRLQPPPPGVAPEAPPVQEPPAAPGLLGSLGLTPDRAAMLKRSLAGGLNAVKSSPFALESFAHGAGGALEGGNKAEDLQEVQKERLLRNAIAMRGQDLNDKYHMGSLGVQQGQLGVSQQNAESLADLRKAQAARPGAWNKPPHQIQLDVDKHIVQLNKEIDKDPRFVPQPTDTPDVRQQKAAAAAAEKAKIKAETYQRYGIDPNAGVGGPPGSGATIGKPITREKYDALPIGAPYMHPSGEMRIKGKKKAGTAPALPAPAAVPDEEDDAA